MTDIPPGWYKDPADTSTQRYWDGEGWLGDAIPANVEPPAGPPTAVRPGPREAPKAPAPERDPERTDPDASISGLPGTSGPGMPPAGPATPPVGPATPPAGPGMPPAGPPPAGPGAPPAEPGSGGWPGASGPTGGWPGGPGGWPGPGGQQGGLPPGYPPGMPFPPQLLRRPASAPAGFVVASPGARVAARLIDIVAVLMLAAAANWLFAYRWWQLFYTYYRQATLSLQNGQSAPTAPQELTNLTLIILVVLTAVWFAYEVPSSANTGQTLGKRLVGIKVMRLESEERLGFGRAWRRWSRIGLPTLLWWCFGVGIVIQLIDCFSVAIDQPLHQALHDKAAATVVVQTRRPTRTPPTTGVSVGGKDDRSHPFQS